MRRRTWSIPRLPRPPVRTWGSSQWRSGWLVRATCWQLRHRPQACPSRAWGQRRSWASPRARRRLPTPSGPTNRYAWCSRPSRTASTSRPLARSCPTRWSKRGPSGVTTLPPPFPPSGPRGPAPPGPPPPGASRPFRSGRSVRGTGARGPGRPPGPGASAPGPDLRSDQAGWAIGTGPASEGPAGTGIEEEGKVGPEVPRGPEVHLADLFEGQPCPVALIGEARVDVPVADDPDPSVQGGPDPLLYMLGPVGGHQEHLGHGDGLPTGRLSRLGPAGGRGPQEDLAEVTAQGRVARFAHIQHPDPPSPPRLGQFTGLG